MKVLHILDYHPEYHSFYGGAEIATLRLIQELNKKNIENFVLITRPDKSGITDGNIIFLNTIYNYIDFKKPKSFKSKILSNLDSLKTFFPLDIITLWNSRKVLKRVKPDIIHFHNFKKLSFSILLWSKFFRIPSVLTIYDYWFFCPNETLVHRSGYICKKYHSHNCLRCFKVSKKFCLFLLLRRYFFNLFLRNIDRYIFLSNASMQVGKNYGLPDKKLKVIYQIFEEFSPEIISFENNTILFIGWVQYRKGLHILIQSLPAIIKEVPDANLYIIGEMDRVEKSYVEHIFTMIRRSSLDRNVIFKGKISYKEIRNYFQKAKVVVIPEQWENMSPVVLVEAMFNKKAIVASNIGGIREFIEDGKEGFLCDPRNPEEFADKIIKLLKSEELVMEFGNKAFIKAKKIWDNETNINKLIKLYEELKNE